MIFPQFPTWTMTKTGVFAWSQPHLQAALRPARWNSDPRPTHPGRTAGEDVSKKCHPPGDVSFRETWRRWRKREKVMCLATLWSLVIRRKMRPPNFQSAYLARFVFSSPPRLNYSFSARYPIGHLSDVSPCAFFNLLTLRPQTIIPFQDGNISFPCSKSWTGDHICEISMGSCHLGVSENGVYHSNCQLNRVSGD